MTAAADRVRRGLEARLRAVDDAQPTLGGGTNCIVLLTPRFVARCGVVGVLTEHETAVIGEARRIDLPCPEILDTGVLASGERYQIYRRLPGSPSAGTLPVTTLTDALVTLHTRARAELFPDLPASLPARARRPEHALAVARAHRAPCWVVAALTAVIDGDGSNRVPLHGDVRPQNVLMDVTGRLSGLLDWSDTHLGDREEDFAFLDPTYWPALAAAYRRCVPVVLDPLRLLGHGAARVLALTDRGVLPAQAQRAWLSRVETVLAGWPVSPDRAPASGPDVRAASFGGASV